MKENRFQVKKGLHGGSWWIEDTQPELGNREGDDDPICVCYHPDDALLVCEALNGRAP